MIPSILSLVTVFFAALGTNMAVNASPVAERANALPACSAVKCPGSDFSECVDSNGKKYFIACDTDVNGLASFNKGSVATLEECLEKYCDNTGCAAVTFNGNFCQNYGGTQLMGHYKSANTTAAIPIR